MNRIFSGRIFVFSVLLVLFTSCGYKERGHSNTPPGYPGTQSQPGPDTLAHPGNIDKDTIRLEE